MILRVTETWGPSTSLPRLTARWLTGTDGSSAGLETKITVRGKYSSNYTGKNYNSDNKAKKYLFYLYHTFLLFYINNVLVVTRRPKLTPAYDLFIASEHYTLYSKGAIIIFIIVDINVFWCPVWCLHCLTSPLTAAWELSDQKPRSVADWESSGWTRWRRTTRSPPGASLVVWSIATGRYSEECRAGAAYRSVVTGG